MKQSKSRLLIFVLAALPLLAGCGSKEPEAEPTTAAVATPAAQASVAATGGSSNSALSSKMSGRYSGPPRGSGGAGTTTP